MNHEPNDDDLRELLALAAVDALDADEQAALEHDLAGRADLRAELEALREAAATIAAATAEAPPPAMRANVLAAIADEPQLAPAAPVATTPPTDVADNVVPMRARSAPALDGGDRCRGCGRRGHRRLRRRRPRER